MIPINARSNVLYLNAEKVGQASPTGDYSDTQEVDVRYRQPILDRTDNMALSVVRFSVPVNTVPVFQRFNNAIRLYLDDGNLPAGEAEREAYVVANNLTATFNMNTNYYSLYEWQRDIEHFCTVTVPADTQIQNIDLKIFISPSYTLRVFCNKFQYVDANGATVGVGIAFSKEIQNLFNLPSHLGRSDAGFAPTIVNGESTFDPSITFLDKVHQLRSINIESTLNSTSELTTSAQRLRIISDFEYYPGGDSAISQTVHTNTFPSISSIINESAPGAITYNSPNPTMGRLVRLTGSSALYNFKIIVSGNFCDARTGRMYTRVLTMAPLSRLTVKLALVSLDKFQSSRKINNNH